MKNKNIHLIPTDKPSRLYKNINGKLGLNIVWSEIPIGRVNQNIYITSDEEIKKGDGKYPVLGCKGTIYKDCPETWKESGDWKKIILTTDQDLIKDGIQAIDDTFLEWFCNNPSCEFVEVTEYLDSGFSYGYKIIIPKEEPMQGNFYEDLVKYFETTPREKVLEDWNKSAHLNNVGPTVDEFLENTNKQQETIENDDTWSLEKAKQFALNHFKRDEKTTKKGIVTWESVLDVLKAGVEVGYKFGTKWQQEQDKNRYNEEEVEKLIELHSDFIDSKIDYEGINNATTAISNPEWDDKEWFKQFKKK